MKFFLSVVTIITLSILLFFCSDTKSKSSLNENLSYETVKYHKITPGCDTVKNENCAEIKIEFPQIKFPENKIVEEKINQSIITLFSQDILGGTESQNFDSLMNGFIQDYESFKKEFPDSPQSWSIERTGDAILNKGNIFSIDYTEYAYTGGAHPNSFVSFKNFNLSDGEEITLDELIPSDKQEKLTAIAESEFRKLKQLKPEDDFGKAGYWFEDNKFSLNDNFLITNSALVFYYNNYEITAYAFGPTELTVTYSEIKSLINNESLLENLIK